MSGTASSLAILGGTPVRSSDQSWPTWPVFDDTERKALLDVFESGKWWFGEQVAGFQEEFARAQGAAYGIACNSGTAACEVCLEALGIRDRDYQDPPFEVLVPPYTFIATASSVVRMGGVPVFVDVDESWCMNPDLIEAAITPQTKAIMPVHFGGRVCDMDRINEIAAKHDLVVLEDACHSWGGKYKGKGTGTLGIAGVFSFQMSKNLTAAEGGAIVTNDEEFARICRSIVNCGRGEEGIWYKHVRFGTNARMTEFQGALLRAQLTRLEKHNDIRERNAAILNQELPAIEGLSVQAGDDRITRRAYHLFCFQVDPDRFGCSREQLIVAAEAEGLPIAPGYGMPLHHQDVFRTGRQEHRYKDLSCPVSEDLCYRSGMKLPHQFLLAEEKDMWDIVSILKKIKENVAALRDMAAK